MIAWGGYDESKPRVRLLLDALRRRGALAAEINIAAWRGVEDKSAATKMRIVGAIVRLLLSYPAAMARLLRQPAGSAVLLPYPGIPDIFLVAPIAKLRRHRIILDAFLPLHDTIVRDRGLVGANGWVARAIRAIERLGLRRADIILVDTDQHRDFFAQEFAIDRSRFVTVLVGAEPLFSEPAPIAEPLPIPADRPLILFYGQLIPLHGLATILEAVRLTRGEAFHWVIVGRGQEECLLTPALRDGGARNMSWIPWVDYRALPALIGQATLCLGIFGVSGKAGRVIPNKLFQALAAGKPAITRASPAVDALAVRYPDTIITVPPGDGQALAAAVRGAIGGRDRLKPLPLEARAELGPDRGVGELLGRLDSACRRRHADPARVEQGDGAELTMRGRRR